MKINFSVGTLLNCLAVSFTMVPVLLFGVYEARSGVERANQQASELNLEASLLIERDIISAINRFKAVFEAFSASVDTTTMRFRDEEQVLKVVKNYPQISTLSLLDKDGTSVWVYSPNGTVRTGINYRDNEVNSRSRTTRQTAVSGTSRSRVTGFPSILFSVPLIGNNQEIVGFIGGSIPIDQFRSAYELTPDQFYLVLDSFGQLVSSSNPPNVAAWTSLVAEASVGDSRIRMDELNARIFVSEVQPIGWRVAVGFPNSYLMARSRDAVRTAVIVGLLCALIGAAIAGGTAFTLTRGLDDVGHQVERMSSADLQPITLTKHRVYPREIVGLIGNFNNLLERAARTHQAEFEAISKVGDTILIARSTGQITYVNEAGAKLFGDVVGQPLEAVIGKLAASTILSTHAPRDWKGEIALLTKDGSSLDGFVSSTSILENNKLTSIVAIVQDITQQKAARETTVQSEKMITLGELVAGTSHELNNPLSIITGYSDLLLEEPKMSPGQRSKVEAIRKNAMRASNVVHSLLAFARKRTPERTKTDINAALEAAVELKEYDLRTSGVSVVKQLTPNLPSVYADPNQLQQVILNVINNAQDAVRTSKIPTITMQTGTKDGIVFIRIQDTGNGIAKADLKKVFDPFFTTKPVGKGTGLGLSISYGIIREHGGEIRVHSQVGHGTEVCIELPINNYAAVQASFGNSVTHAISGGRFLVVDDEADMAAILQVDLSRKGNMVDTANNIVDAIELVRKNTYDYVITDVKMPGGSGIDLYRQLCVISPDFTGRVVFLTGDTSNPSTIQFLEREGLPYFSKPFDLDSMHTFLAKQGSRLTRG